ncbi:MAG: IPT/TIG domain-containing protein, partial [Myxococcota bacterium]
GGGGGSTDGGSGGGTGGGATGGGAGGGMGGGATGGGAGDGGTSSVTVTSVRPGWGAPNDTVVVTGTNFVAGQVVLLGGVPCTVVAVDSSTSLRILVPPGLVAGTTYDLSVDGVTLPNAFRWYSRAPLFQSDWSTAAGTTLNALSDGMRWGNVAASNPNLAVVNAADAGLADWPSTNALRVVQSAARRSSAWCEIKNAWPLPLTGESLYYRAYLRVDMPTAYSGGENSHHPVETMIDYNNGYTAGFLWSFAPVGNGRFSIHTGFTGNPYPLANYGLTSGVAMRTNLFTGATYRLEWKLTRQGPDSYTTVIRYYDAAGVLLGSSDPTLTPNNIRALGRQDPLNWPLASTVQPLFVDETYLRHLRFGTNGGTGWVNTSDEYFYWGGVMVRSDAWCGPY